jgi:hypothetical protein
MRFAVAMLVMMYVGRHLGWFISLRLSYWRSGAVLVSLLVAWGSTIACIVRIAVEIASPGGLLRWVLGYFLGAYVASPSYGLIDESTVPPEAQRRHKAISVVPLGAYWLVSFLLGARQIDPRLLLLLIWQSLGFAVLGCWLGFRSHRIARILGAILIGFVVFNSVISLLDLAFIGDPLPGGSPTPGGAVDYVQAIGEYAGAAIALITGWSIGSRHRKRLRSAQAAAATA